MVLVSIRLSIACMLIACGACSVAAVAADSRTRPNIVVILADDLGFSDIGCYGSEIETPNLDQLARNGLRFTQFYNCGRCCPTRASLLTGLYPHQAGMGHMTDDRGQDGYRGDLNAGCVTVAEVLQDAGYSTSMVGKWHVTRHTAPNAPAEQRVHWPRQRGFDRFFGVLKGTSDYFSPNGLFLDDSLQRTVAKDFYTTDAFVDHAIRFIAERPKDKPFFLYTAFNAPHFPVQAPAEDIARHRGRYKAGWDALRERRRAKQVELGIVDEKWPLSPRADRVRAWDGLAPAKQDRFDELMAVYAACVERMDKAVGRLIDAIEQQGCLDDTLILFLSDNGGNAETGPDGQLKGDPATAGSHCHCGESWATLQNTPFRRFKHFTHEGGIATPLVVHWPNGIAARGALRLQPGHLIDIMPTCVAVSGAAYPAERHGTAVLPMEGVSLLPAFAGQPLGRDTLYWEHEGNAAIRDGDWKLVRVGKKGPWELYNLRDDRTELSDLAAGDPARAKELQARWDAWAKRANVIPYPEVGRHGESHQ
jgi:arylsulfatase A-like enzyme